MITSPAVRVAAAATTVVAVVFVSCAIALNVIVARDLTGQRDTGLAARLAAAQLDPALVTRPSPQSGGRRGETNDIDGDAAPILLWSVTSRGTVIAHTPGAPALPATMLANGRDGQARTAKIGASKLRLQLARHDGGWLVAGQSLAGDAHTERLLIDGELVAGPFVIVAMFLGSLVVGLRALAPVEQSRRRQLEFTADASHELRTPLSVIRAEADVALSNDRDAASYRDTLVRIRGESGRLNQLVDDMLWLARFDSKPPRPGNEPVDLVALTAVCADRFRAVGPAVSAETPGRPVLISAPPQWIDRLAGVLMDNACRYAGPEGKVTIRVGAHRGKVTLSVADSGPGIAAEDRDRLFDRFHRTAEPGSGAGLGLAIGDSIVRSTGGRWHVGTSPLGGALMSVSWRHHQRGS